MAQPLCCIYYSKKYAWNVQNFDRSKKFPSSILCNSGARIIKNSSYKLHLWWKDRYWNILTPCFSHKGLDFLPFCIREITLVTSCLLSNISSPFWKGIYSKRKEFAPKREQILSFWSKPFGSKFFLFRVNPFSEGRKKNFGKVASPERIIIPIKSFPWKLIH